MIAVFCQKEKFSDFLFSTALPRGFLFCQPVLFQGERFKGLQEALVHEGVSVEALYPDFDSHPPQDAGPLRDEAMVDAADIVLAVGRAPFIVEIEKMAKGKFVITHEVTS